MKIRKLILMASLSMAACGAFGAEAPEVKLSVTNRLQDEAVAPGVCAVSNVKRIDARVTFDPKDIKGLPPFAEVALNPVRGRAPQSIVVTAKEYPDGAPVAVKASIHGRSLENGRETVSLFLEILEENSVREKKLQDVVDEILHKQSAVSGAESDRLVDQLIEKNDEIVEALKKIYYENRVGKFTLKVEYRSSHEGSWKGSVVSDPLVIEVLNKGSFAESLKLR